MIRNRRDIDSDSSRESKMSNIITGFAFVLPAMFAFSIQRIMSRFPAFVENIYSTTVFKWISAPISLITSLFKFSLTELTVYLSLPILVFIIILIVKGIKRSKSRKKLVVTYIKRIAWTMSILYFIFMLLLGFNYARMPLSKSMRIQVIERSHNDLEYVSYILLDRVNDLRTLSVEVDGVTSLRNGIDSALKNGYLGYDAIKEIFPLLNGPSVRAKGVLSSHLWSYTGIAGMYFPFYVEANVNIDVPEFSIPNTVMHELAHLRGIAREDEAEFVAFITGINHPDKDFKYSAYLNAFLYTLGSLRNVDQDAFNKVFSNISDPVLRDIYAGDIYWKQFEGRISEVSNTVNDVYLQSNMQQDGVDSYGRVVDLILGYYLTDNS